MYASQIDILLQLSQQVVIELTDDDDAGVIDSDKVDRAIDDATAEIDAYVSAVASIPLDPVPDLIRKICVDIAIYNLFSLKDDTIPDIRITRYKNAILKLKQIKNKDIVLPDVVGTPAINVTTLKSDRIFTLGKISDGSVGTLDDF